MSNFLIKLLSIMILLTASLQAFAGSSTAFEGRKLYVSYCMLCHGKTGKGDGSLSKAMKITPADLTTTVRSRSNTILTKIITGKGGQTITGRDRHNILSDAMPEWNDIFDDDQVTSLIAYLRFLGRGKHRLMGNPEDGLALYQEYCTVCHGVEGDGDGMMTQLIGITPMDHTNPNETNSLSNADIIHSIQKGKGRFMPAWEGVLTQDDVEAIVSYIRLLSQ